MNKLTKKRAMKKLTKIGALAATVAAVTTVAAHAGTTGDEFQDAYNLLVGWINGFFGRALAVAFLLVGLFMGIARQNLMACGVSIAVAFGLVITPTILDNILTTTVSDETVVIDGTYSVIDETPVAQAAIAAE